MSHCFSFGKCRIDGTLAQAGGVQLYLLRCLLVPLMAECILHLRGLWELQPLEVLLMGGAAGRLYPYLAPPNGCSCFHGSYPRCRPGGPKFHCPFLSRSLLEKLNLIQWVRKRLICGGQRETARRARRFYFILAPFCFQS